MKDLLRRVKKEKREYGMNEGVETEIRITGLLADFFNVHGFFKRVFTTETGTHTMKRILRKCKVCELGVWYHGFRKSSTCIDCLRNIPFILNGRMLGTWPNPSHNESLRKQGLPERTLHA